MTFYEDKIKVRGPERIWLRYWVFV